MGSDAGWKVGGGGGGGSRENLAIITKDFEKSSLVLIKMGGACPVFISFLHQTHFTFRLYFCCRSILETLLPHLEAEKTCARRALISGRKTEMYICCCCLPRFCLVFPTGQKLRKGWGEKP